jgi:hypothetical protein
MTRIGDKLPQEKSEWLKEEIEQMGNTNRRYTFSEGGNSITEVGIGGPGGEVTKVKFQTAVPITAEEPVWVALGRRILELEAQLTRKAAEFMRMENTWRREVSIVEHQRDSLESKLDKLVGKND